MKSDKNIEDKCFFHEQSRRQRALECEKSIPKVVTRNFESLGCYKCTGYYFKCEHYLSNKDAREKGNE
jgi:hypothetical protein